jgi:dynein heavy chain
MKVIKPFLVVLGLANMSNILASRYVRPLRMRAEKMQSDLLLLSDIIDKWVEC